MKKRTFIRAAALVALLCGLIAVPAAAEEEPGAKVSEAVLEHISESVAVNYWAANPDQAPSRLRKQFQNMDHERDRTNASNRNFCASNANRDTYNATLRLPQNESRSGHVRPRNLVLGGRTTTAG